MKIVYYLPSLYAPGGLERVVTFKANYFAETVADCDVTIITSEQAGRAPHFALSPKVHHIDLGVAFDYPFNQSHIARIVKYPLRYLRFKRRLSETLRAIRPDITISTLRRELHFITKIDDGSVKIGEFHVTRHSYGFGVKSKNPIIGALRSYLDRRFARNLSRLSRLVLLTHEEEQNWLSLHNTTVIPNPIITPFDRVSECTAKQVIAAGRYEPQKGFDMLIESWAEVARRHPEWRLKIYGDGGMRSDMERRVAELGIAQSCLLCPTTQKIADKYCESSIYVLSSRFEGFGMVIIEAMSCGVPVVSFGCPCGPRDIITDGRDGVIVEAGDTHALAEQICRLIDDDELRRTMGRNAKAASEKYRMEHIAPLWQELFEEVIKEHKNVVR